MLARSLGATSFRNVDNAASAFLARVILFYMRKLTDFLQQAARVVVLSVVAATAFSVVLAWTGPTATPPNNNASTPLNVSSTAQTKAGNLTVSGSITTSNYYYGANAFGGDFANSSSGCQSANAWTGGCSCPSFAPNAGWLAYTYYNSVPVPMYICY